MKQNLAAQYAEKATVFNQRASQYGTNVKKASTKAFNKTMKWYRAQVISYCVTRLDIPRAVFKGRWFVDRAARHLWLGLNDVPVHRFGKPRQTKAGVKVRNMTIESAFVWGRVVFERVGKKRLPIEKTYREIEPDVTLAFERFQPQAIEEFFKNLDAELMSDG